MLLIIYREYLIWTLKSCRKGKCMPMLILDRFLFIRKK